ncbi:MAG: hypothetical protein V4459_13675 [Pseudomonadota bacterium]
MTIPSFASAALFGLALTAGVAQADPKERNAPVSDPTPTSQPEKSRAQDQKICVVDAMTGTRIPQKVCKTRREWMAEGVDPLNP